MTRMPDFPPLPGSGPRRRRPRPTARPGPRRKASRSEPVYGPADADGLASNRQRSGPAAVPPRPLPHHVRRTAVDDPPVCGFLHGAGFQRLLPEQPRRRTKGPLGRLRPPNPSRLRFRRAERRGRCRHGGRRHRFHPRHGGALRRHPARRDDRLDDDEWRRAADDGALHRRGRAPGGCRRKRSPARSRTTS